MHDETKPEGVYCPVCGSTPQRTNTIAVGNILDVPVHICTRYGCSVWMYMTKGTYLSLSMMDE